MRKKTHIVAGLIIGLLITSCSAIRGYLKDGTDGPGIYSFEHHAYDTIAKGRSVFNFPVAKSKAYWICSTCGNSYHRVFAHVSLCSLSHRRVLRTSARNCDRTAHALDRQKSEA